jgi:tRNA dimethylallyltransferase
MMAQHFDSSRLAGPPRYLIVVGGATATGKTEVAIRLAQHFGTDIVSADSRQFYREMSIGTAKPTAAELAQAQHYFIDSLSVTDDYSVGDFERDALHVLSGIFEKNQIAVMAGGSGLYIRAICEGLDTFPEVPDSVRDYVALHEQKQGLAWLQSEVARLDPTYFTQADANNPARLRRALEVCVATDVAYSSFLGKEKPTRPFRPIYVLLDEERTALYRRIDARVDAMIDAGLEAEAHALLPYRDRPALRTVGYEEWWPYFDGQVSKTKVVEQIKQYSRNYAKRQGTWFRKHGEWSAFKKTEAVQIFNFVEKQISK